MPPWQEPTKWKVESETYEVESGKYFTYSFVIQPEGKPRHDHNHEAGNVDGDNIEGELPGEDQIHPETAVGPGGGGDIASLVGGVRHLEPPRQTQVGRELKSPLSLPDIDQVVSSPPVYNKKTSHWLSSYITALSLVESVRVLKYFQSVAISRLFYAIKNQLKAPKAPEIPNK